MTFRIVQFIGKRYKFYIFEIALKKISMYDVHLQFLLSTLSLIKTAIIPIFYWWSNKLGEKGCLK